MQPILGLLLYSMLGEWHAIPLCIYAFINFGLDNGLLPSGVQLDTEGHIS